VLNGKGEWLHENDPRHIYQEHLLLEPLYRVPDLLAFVRSV
jgi:hypothetical protein